MFKLQTQSEAWEIKNPPSNALLIKGPSLAFPVLDSISIIRSNVSGPMKLLLMTNVTLPDSISLKKLYAKPLDSLIGTHHTFDGLENGFNNLGFFQFSEDQAHSTYSLQLPITHKKTYIFGLSDHAGIEVNVLLYFHRLGSNEIPDVQIITLE